MQELRIDPEFRDKIPPLTDAEFSQLEENILRDGEVYEPITVWNGVIVDGHNRWKIIQAHPELKWHTRELDFADKWGAFEWMYRNQLGRRNLTDEQRTMLIGKMYEARKNAHGNHADRGADGRYLSCQNGNLGGIKAKDLIAKDLGVGGSTVVRAEKFAKGVDAIREVSAEAADKILQGNSGLSKKDVMDIPKMEESDRNYLAKAVASGDIKAAKEAIVAMSGNKAQIDSNHVVDEVSKETAAAVAEATKQQEAEKPAYTVDDFAEHLADFPGMLDRGIGNVLEDHGDMLQSEDGKAVFASMLDCVDVIIKKYRRML